MRLNILNDNAGLQRGRTSIDDVIEVVMVWIFLSRCKLQSRTNEIDIVVPR